MVFAGADAATGKAAAAAQDLACTRSGNDVPAHGKVIRPQLARLLPDPAAVDGATQSLALDMLCQAVFCTVDSLVARRTPLDAEAFMHQLQALFLTVQQI